MFFFTRSLEYFIFINVSNKLFFDKNEFEYAESVQNRNERVVILTMLMIKINNNEK